MNTKAKRNTSTTMSDQTMKFDANNSTLHQNPTPCEAVRAEFADYLDGTVTGVEMNALADHMQGCTPCSQEFTDLRTLQQGLSALGPVLAPERLHARLRSAIAVERERGTHLPFAQRALRLWEATLAPLALRASAGLAVALVLLGGLGYIFEAPLAVQANDDNLAHLVGPHYLYSQVPPQPIVTRHDAPIVVEAKVNTQGRVYDYAILEGPSDPAVQVRVQDNLLASVFKPATVFGVPVKGQVVLTYTGVSVHG